MANSILALVLSRRDMQGYPFAIAQGNPRVGTDSAWEPGGLNGSVQHLLVVYPPEFEIPFIMTLRQERRDIETAYSGITRKTVAFETGGAFHGEYFISLAWSTAAFSAGSLTTDKVRSNSWSPILSRT
jgi:hypothetical protein